MPAAAAADPSATLWWLLPAIGLLVLLITWGKWHAFPALVVASAGFGIASGLAPITAVQKFTEGFGGTLGFLAGIIAFGTMLGGLLGASGGAAVIARSVSGRSVGPRWAGRWRRRHSSSGCRSFSPSESFC